MAPTAVLDDLLSGGTLSKRVEREHADDAAAIWGQLSTWTAASEAWRDLVFSKPKRAGPEDLAFAASSWALAVVYVRDLARPPVSEALAGIDALPPRSSRPASASRGTCASGTR